MSDRRRHRILKQFVAIRAAERAAAETEFFLANVRQREAEDASKRADEHTEKAAGAWHEHLAHAAFDPDLARGLAAQLTNRARAAADADGHVCRMRDKRDRRAIEWQERDACFRQTQEMLDVSRRTIARDREDRALEALADRVSFAWSQR